MAKSKPKKRSPAAYVMSMIILILFLFLPPLQESFFWASIETFTDISYNFLRYFIFSVPTLSCDFLRKNFWNAVFLQTHSLRHFIRCTNITFSIENSHKTRVIARWTTEQKSENRIQSIKVKVQNRTFLSFKNQEFSFLKFLKRWAPLSYKPFSY